MGRVALVTGAAGRGIGRSVALALARDGYDIALTYRSSDAAADEVAGAINELGRRAEPIRSDLFDVAACEALVPQVLRAFGRLDVLVIGPGADWHPEPPESLDPNHALADARQEMLPVFALAPAAIAAMSATGGRIVGIGTNERLPSPSYAYNTAKRARTAALLGLAGACWKHRITVNVVAPGPVEPLGAIGEAMAMTADFSATGPAVSPQDIAEIVAFLCSDKGRYVTGNEIGTQF